MSQKGKTARVEACVDAKTEQDPALIQLCDERDLLHRVMETSPICITMVDREGRIVFANTQAEQVLGLSRSKITDLTYNAPDWHITDYEGHPFPEEELPFQRVMATGEPVEGVRHAVEWPNGERKLLSINGAPLFNAAGEIERVVFAIQDVTEEVLSEDALAWDARVNGVLAELSAALLSPNPLDEISYLVLERAKHLTESPFGYVGYINPDTGHLICATLTRDVWDECQVPGKSAVFDTFGGLWGWVLEEKKSVLTNDPGSDVRSTGVPEGHIPIHRFLSAPAMIGDELVGQVALANAERDYTGRDLDLVERLAFLYALDVQRRRMEKALQEERDFVGAVLDTVGVLVIVLDREGRVVRFNRACEELTGYTFEEVEGEPLWDLFLLPEEIEPVRGIFQALLGRDFPNENENYWKTRDGQERLIAWRNTALVNEMDEVTYIIGTGVDITEQKASEEALRESEERFRQLAETIREVFWIGSPDWREILYVSPAYDQIWGLSRYQLYENPDAWYGIIHEEDLDRVRAAVERRVGGDFSDVEFPEYRIVRPDGSVRWILARAYPIMDESGTIYRVAGIAEDITERKQVELAREREFATLEQLSGSPRAGITAQTFGLVPLQQSAPLTFEESVEEFEVLIEQVLEERIFKVDHDVASSLRAAAERLGRLQAGPRDVVDIYLTALKRMVAEAPVLKAQAYAEEGRLMALELMGYLVSYYRNYLMGAGRADYQTSSDRRRET